MASPLQEIDDVLEDLETLLKNTDVTSALAEKNVNASLAMLALDGLAAYLRGDKTKALEELHDFFDEVEHRKKMS